MLKLSKLVTLLVVFVVTVSAGTAARAQQSKSVLPGPFPAQIIAAKSVFISNGGGECNPFGADSYSGRQDRAYDQLFAGMKSWGRYKLATNPGEADLVFEIHFTCPFYFDEKVTKVDPQFKLIVFDATTHFVLWTFVEHVQWAILQNNRDRNFDGGIDTLLHDLKNVAGQSTSGGPN